jgi:nifR3 family TIM-barrel protein
VLLADIIRSAVRAAEPHGVPVTVKFRIGIDERTRTSVQTGRIAAAEGAAAIALHARTAEQRYADFADWSAIAELKAAVTTIPVLGNGDIWEAGDAVRMLADTGCDGVVVGRGCLGRPWLFRELVDALAGRPVGDPPRFGFVAEVMRRHARLLVDDAGERIGITDFRKHAGWYAQGYALGSDLRHRLSLVKTVADLEAVLDETDPELALPPEGRRMRRGHTDGPRPVALPEGWLDLVDDPTPPVGAELLVSGG